MNESAPSRLQLLRMEMDALWTSDRLGRVHPEPEVALAVAGEEYTLRVSSTAPAELRRDLANGRCRSAEEALERCRMRFGPLGETSGPSYLFPAVSATPPPPLEIVTSSLGFGHAPAVPEPWWEPEEWSDLLSGRLGPWAVGILEGSVVSLCHTPVAGFAAAEAGVWTHPEARGRDYAVAVTAAWAGVARREFETLFYSTGSDNLASQGVARKLGLVSLGVIWQFRSSNP